MKEHELHALYCQIIGSDSFEIMQMVIKYMTDVKAGNDGEPVVNIIQGARRSSSLGIEILLFTL